MIRQIVDKCQTQLEQKLLFGAKAQLFNTEGVVDFGRGATPIYDNLDSIATGYSYLTSSWPFTKYQKSLLDHIRNTPELKYQFFQPTLSDSGDLCPNASGIGKWLIECDIFQDLLATCVYFLGGQPPRAMELVAFKITNTPRGVRNLYCMANNVTIFTDYTKGENKTDTTMPVFRVLAHALQEILEVFVVAVKPVYTCFSTMLDKYHAEPAVNFQHLLFNRNGRAMTGREFSHALRDITMHYTGHDWGVRAWRQVIVTIADHELPLDIQQMTAGSSIVHLQTSHHSGTHIQHYGRLEEGATKSSNAHDFSKFQAASVEWHRLLGFPHPTVPCGVPILVANPSDPNAVTINDRKAFSIEIADHINHRNIAILDQTVKDVIQSTVATILEERNEPIRAIPLDITVPMSTKHAFQNLFGPEKKVEFRSSEQAQGVHYILSRGLNPLIAILPMGHGKSALYQVACKEESNTSQITVVVVPLRGLAQSATHSATAVGINAKMLAADIDEGAQEDCFTSQLVVMTYDLLATNSRVFTRLLTMGSSGSLARIVIDEAHTLITDIKFRTNFTQVYPRITGLGVPLIFLTGTLPPKELVEFKEMLSAHHICHTLRLSTDIPQLYYSVDQLQGCKDTLKQFVELVKSHLFPSLAANPEERAIIFCRTRDYTDQIADQLQVGLYHSTADHDAKRLSLERWLDQATTDIKQVSICKPTATNTNIHPLSHSVSSSQPPVSHSV
jgi:DEAD/DEAH box helicase